jgi:hypothetical protein
MYRESGLINPLHTVNHNTAFGGGGQYVVEVILNTGGFKGVDIWWKGQISPAPGSASFTDVPVGAQFFAEIEAMKAAGITATTYCPDATVTRRQMAAFFARGARAVLAVLIPATTAGIHENIRTSTG